MTGKMIGRIKEDGNRRKPHPEKKSLPQLQRLIPEIETYAESILQTGHEALLDLTGLYKRRGFSTFAEQHIKLARRSQTELLLVFLDLDGLKHINDTFGHQEGDRALVRTAQMLKGIFHRDLDIIARLSGDEFVVLTLDSFHGSVEIISARLQEYLDNTNANIDCGYRLSFCIGMKRFNPNYRMTVNDLMSRADVGLYKNKRARTSSEETTIASARQGQLLN